MVHGILDEYSCPFGLRDNTVMSVRKLVMMAVMFIPQ